MRRLGLSIYPDKSDANELKEYLKYAYEKGFRRIFSSLIEFENLDDQETKNKFIDINKFARELGYEIIIDVNPAVFDKLGVSAGDYSFFSELYIDGIRLDGGFNGFPEAQMTHNDQNLKIEVNMSIDNHMVDAIMDYQPNRYNLIGCHNFYPHNYSGLSLEFFNKTTEQFNKYKLRTAAFITSQSEDAFGPWPVDDKIPTLEMHRNLPIDVQLKHYVAMDNIDDILISNSYATKEELDKLSKVNLNKVVFDVKLNENITDLMRKIVLEEEHLYRGDVSDHLIRSSQSRVKYKGSDFPQVNTPDEIKKGDILIDGNGYGHYTGELQIAKTDMKNNGLTNVVGHIVEDEVFILDFLRPWQRFGLKLHDEAWDMYWFTRILR